MGIDLNLLFIVDDRFILIDFLHDYSESFFCTFILPSKEQIEPVSRPRQCAMVEEVLQGWSWVKLLLFGEFGGAVSSFGSV